MPWSSFILSCHFEEFDYSQNVLLVLSLRLIQFIGTFSFMVRGAVHSATIFGTETPSISIQTPPFGKTPQQKCRF